MKHLVISCCLLALLLSYTSCDDPKTTQKSLTKEITFKDEGKITIYKQNTETAIKSFTIEIAEGEYETQTGLMYRKSMDRNNGMLFLFDTPQVRSFYMKNTEFPLDILYIDEHKKIVKVYTNTTPFDLTSLSSEAPVQYVLELNGAVSSSYGIQAGDRVAWTMN